MIHADSITRKVLQYIRANPGCERKDILTVLPDVKPRTVSRVMDVLQRGGAIENRGTERSKLAQHARWYAINISVDPKYFKIAQALTAELQDVHHILREEYLAKRLQEIFGS